MKRLTILTVLVILALSSSGCRRGSRCFGLRGSHCGRRAIRAPWKKPKQQVIYQPVPVPVAAPYNACPPPQPSCDPCPPVGGCPAPGYMTPAYPAMPGAAVPGTTVQPYTQGYGAMGQIVPGSVIDGGVVQGGVVQGGVMTSDGSGNPVYGNVVSDRILQPSATAPGLQTVPLDK